ncbi:hypothetical protein LguiB_024749 [Lonicera macranthoides]
MASYGSPYYGGLPYSVNRHYSLTVSYLYREKRRQLQARERGNRTGFTQVMREGASREIIPGLLRRVNRAENRILMLSKREKFLVLVLILLMVSPANMYALSTDSASSRRTFTYGQPDQIRDAGRRDNFFGLHVLLQPTLLWVLFVL